MYRRLGGSGGAQSGLFVLSNVTVRCPSPSGGIALGLPSKTRKKHKNVKSRKHGRCSHFSRIAPGIYVGRSTCFT